MTKNKYEHNENYAKAINHLVDAITQLKILTVETNEMRFKNLEDKIIDIAIELKDLGEEK